VHRTTNVTTGNLCISLLSLGKGQIGGKCRITFQLAIKPPDAVENRLCHFYRGQLSCLNETPDFNEIEKARII
jgi:hypothetical protein